MSQFEKIFENIDWFAFVDAICELLIKKFNDVDERGNRYTGSNT